MRSLPPPSATRRAHLHFQNRFNLLIHLLPFVVVNAAVGLADHAEEASVADVEIVLVTEQVPSILEQSAASIILRDAPLQAHEPGLPGQPQLDQAPLPVALRLLEVHRHILRLVQKKD